MAIYDGVVTLADDDIPVIVELDEGRIRMSASGTEIGDWRTDECEIVHLSDASYAIRAENESLHFVPNQPGLFAAALDSGETPAVAMPPPSTEPRSASDGQGEAPPPKPLTVGLFYALSVITLAMAAWSLATILL